MNKSENATLLILVKMAEKRCHVTTCAVHVFRASESQKMKFSCS